MEEELYGASSTNPRSIAGMGVLNSLSGGSGDLVQQYVNEAVPLPKKADPYVAALKFFIEMGKQASQPGSTVLGSITGSMGAPVDYLEAKALERQKAEQARSALGLQIAPSLNSTSTTTSTGSYVFQSPDAYNRFKAAFPKVAETLTEGQIAGTEPLIINKNLLTDPNLPNIFKEPPTADPSGSAASEIAKLYDDLNIAKDEASKAAEAFLLANPSATPEEISAAAQNNPAFAEAQTLQEKINSLAAASGFNKEIYSAESELRKEWRRLKDPFNDISAGHKKLIASLEAQTGVGDMSAVFAYMKMLDENSVVRESEFQSAQNTSGLYQSLMTKFDQLKKGNLLSPIQRKEFMDLANQFYKVTEQFIDKNRLDLGITVSTYPMLNPRSVFGGSEEAPNSFYSDAVVFRTARDSGFTMDELWREMTDDEKAEYLP
jgi:hypothetical protein